MEKFGLKDSFTLANAAMGVMAIVFYSFGYLASFLFLLAAMLFDFLDGYHARSSKTSNAFGKQLDSLADAISFVTAPALVVLFSVTRGLYDVSLVLFALVSVLVFVMAGLTRLAKFNLQKEKGVYYGLPTPYAALFLMGLMPFLNYNLYAVSLVSVVLAGLMLSPLKARKLF
ncbi:CDP-alcohol phosphatidyltransferase family protein [Candidatus Micrarchaeota archaeon]|nr:CDP-alcohol phosphatidyltransferase family protein [Candidatus Micrarchaeota archaeon]